MRSRRVSITGFEEALRWEVNEAGVIYRQRHRQPITNLIHYLPTVDVGPTYAGPVPPPGCAADCPGCRGDGAKHKPSTLRLVEEIVCYQFHGAPSSWNACRVVHHDGDDGNCSAGNLSWIADAEYLQRQDELVYRRFMRPSNLPPSRAKGIAGSNGLLVAHKVGNSEPLFTGSSNVPGHLPTRSERIA